MNSLSPDLHGAALALTAFFLFALVAHLGIDLYLARRQINHVRLHRGAVPSAFQKNITLPAHKKAADYTVTSVRFGMREAVWSALVLIGWTFFGGLNALNHALSEWMGAGFGQQLVLLLAFGAISSLLSMPWTLYKTFRIEERFGFNKMTLKLWLKDSLSGLVVGLIVGVPLLAAILGLMQAAGSLWWLWAWAVWTGFGLLMMWLFPTFIAPLFNKFKPLEDQELKTRILDLMERSGFKAQGLYVMDGSKRSAHANAYFTGLGNAKRVVFFDTLINKLSPAEIEAVLAHELGHFKCKHITKRMVSSFALSFLAFALLGWLVQQPWFFFGLNVVPTLTQAGTHTAVGANSALALIVFSMLAGVVGGLVQPLWAQLSRKHEFEADAYAVEHASGEDLANALLKLYKDNASTLTPDPLYAQFHYSHPPASERLARMKAAAQ